MPIVNFVYKLKRRYSDWFVLAAPRIPDGGIEGVLYTADPLEACSDLSVNVTGTTSFALVMRGNCTFEQKIRNCQNAGFTAVIIFNNKDTNELVSSTLLVY